jgi:uncharacterized lipoprotein YajG
MSRGVAALVVVLSSGALMAGCSTSTEGARVSCTLSACTTTFDRGAKATASVLGADMRLITADEKTVTVDVGGNQLVVPVGSSQEVGGLSVTVDKVTEQQVVLKVTKA